MNNWLREICPLQALVIFWEISISPFHVECSLLRVYHKRHPQRKKSEFMYRKAHCCKTSRNPSLGPCNFQLCLWTHAGEGCFLLVPIVPARGRCSTDMHFRSPLHCLQPWRRQIEVFNEQMWEEYGLCLTWPILLCLGSLPRAHLPCSISRVRSLPLSLLCECRSSCLRGRWPPWSGWITSANFTFTTSSRPCCPACPLLPSINVLEGPAPKQCSVSAVDQEVFLSEFDVIQKNFFLIILKSTACCRWITNCYIGRCLFSEQKKWMFSNVFWCSLKHGFNTCE